VHSRRVCVWVRNAYECTCLRNQRAIALLSAVIRSTMVSLLLSLPLSCTLMWALMCSSAYACAHRTTKCACAHLSRCKTTVDSCRPGFEMSGRGVCLCVCICVRVGVCLATLHPPFIFRSSLSRFAFSAAPLSFVRERGCDLCLKPVSWASLFPQHLLKDHSAASIRGGRRPRLLLPTFDFSSFA
jgi:hypothetical protein